MGLFKSFHKLMCKLFSHKMGASLLFIDESSSPDTRLSSLTALRIPLDKVDEYRLNYYRKIKKRLGLDEDQVHTHLPALHGCAMLKDYEKADDEMKIGAFSDVVDLVLDADLRLYRGGYYVSRSIHKIAGNSESGEGFAYSVTWMAILKMLEPYSDNNYIIPVMDGFQTDQVRRFSQMLTTTGMIRAQEHGNMLSIRNTHHILGEVYYADDQYSVLTQSVDVCSYLRHILDRERAGNIDSDFANALTSISRRLDPIIVREEIVVINLDGQATGPMDVSHFYENPDLYK